MLFSDFFFKMRNYNNNKNNEDNNIIIKATALCANLNSPSDCSHFQKKDIRTSKFLPNLHYYDIFRFGIYKIKNHNSQMHA